MKDILELKLPVIRKPVKITVEVGGQDYTGHFIPLYRAEFAEIQKKDNADEHLIYESWVDELGNKRLQSVEEAGKFPPLAFNKLVQACLEASGFGKKAKTDAKKD